MEAITRLQQLGFGEYEARAYAALLQHSPLNGYELAKYSGVPRANIYAVLKKLEERGAVLREQTPEGTRYTPAPPDELLHRLSHHFAETLHHAGRALDEISRPADQTPVWNARGYGVMLEHAQGLLDAAGERLQLATWPQEVAALAEHIAAAEARGVEMTTLCLPGCPQACGACRGQVHRYRVTPQPDSRWFILVRDGAEVLAGDIGPGTQTSLIRTRQHLLVDLLAWYIQHSVALGAVLGDLGGLADLPLTSETLSVLATLHPQEGDAGWLQNLGTWPAGRLLASQLDN